MRIQGEVLPEKWVLVHAAEMPAAGSAAWPRMLVPAETTGGAVLGLRADRRRVQTIVPLVTAAVSLGAVAIVTSTHLLADDTGAVVVEGAVAQVPGRPRPLAALLAAWAPRGRDEVPAALLLCFCEARRMPGLVAALAPAGMPGATAASARGPGRDTTGTWEACATVASAREAGATTAPAEETGMITTSVWAPRRTPNAPPSAPLVRVTACSTAAELRRHLRAQLVESLLVSSESGVDTSDAAS